MCNHFRCHVCRCRWVRLPGAVNDSAAVVWLKVRYVYQADTITTPQHQAPNSGSQYIFTRVHLLMGCHLHRRQLVQPANHRRGRADCETPASLMLKAPHLLLLIAGDRRASPAAELKYWVLRVVLFRRRGSPAITKPRVLAAGC